MISATTRSQTQASATL
jgi:MerR family transcriptional regulator, redox-sensitive transcriptional activator SoxR